MAIVYDNVVPPTCPKCGAGWVQREGAFGQIIKIPDRPRADMPMIGGLRCAQGHLWTNARQG
jgi:hypothetical protein